MQRFLFDTSDIWNDTLILQDKELLNQITKVLRSSVWDSFIFFNWEDYFDYKYSLSSFDKKNMIFKLESKIQKFVVQKNINLYQSLPNKLDKLELILQKWVEVWYKDFYIFKASRSQKLFISDNKIERLNKIIKEATEQSWRNTKPNLIFIDKVDLSNIKGQNIFFHTQNNNSISLKDIELDLKNTINVFVWPEWWFSDDEVESFTKNDFKQVYLWKNILRTETASIWVWFYINQL